MVQAQAMACGLPLICTTNTGGEDLISDGKEGFVIPARNISKLKEKLLWCYQNQSDCRDMGNKAFEKIRGGHQWDNYGQSLVSQLEQKLN